MGYTTEFRGSMTITPTPEPALVAWVNQLNHTRRMRRQVADVYGVEGEFYVDGAGYRGQHSDATVVDSNTPPRTQPGLWCQWWIVEGHKLEWDGGEKFYEYTVWLAYLYREVLWPLGYRLAGRIEWRGEDWGDTGALEVTDEEPQFLDCSEEPGAIHCDNGSERFLAFYELVWKAQYLTQHSTER